MTKWDVCKTIITERERPSNFWTRGTYYEGLVTGTALVAYGSEVYKMK